ncbi:acyl-CoA Delta(11) desaturase-like [Achroia grisella]|uniref:acyl-CoA Delta(11) desaturase-like n=1 Tax=Achroia grisella TaxID=688607 RepID=UPI0027D2FAFE|nr:acyl-CoA Delta(11) desaturase-like [Achroia grisella]
METNPLVKHNVIKFAYMHLAALYGIYLCFTSAKWATIIWSLLLLEAAKIGITAGAHRLWCHRAYKAKMPLQIILLIFNSLAFMNTATYWVRDHRLHHKYMDTDADPHNSNRGFFFSQIGWLFVKKHPEVLEKGKTIYMDDIYNDPLLRFQRKHAILVIGTCAYLVPTIVPMYFWNESFSNSWHIATMLRHVLTINLIFLVNSIGHRWGSRPFDKSIKPVENLSISLLTTGECFHNYHHVFPYDYKASELGDTKFNAATLFINFFAKIGWAYDLKIIPDKTILARIQRTGVDKTLWGWGDKDQTQDEINGVEYLYTNRKAA